jgi:hypothetical protein
VHAVGYDAMRPLHVAVLALAGVAVWSPPATAWAPEQDGPPPLHVRQAIGLPVPLLPVPAPAPKAAPRPVKAPRPLATTHGITSARAYARTRPGRVAFAVLGQDGALHGLHTTERFPSASVVKAMLLVARLRQLGDHPLTPSDTRLLAPMIRWSANESAEAIHAEVGDAGLLRVAALAGMRHFAVAPNLFDAQITAADQARFFLRIDRLIPVKHRAYARSLFDGIIPGQRWGIPPVAVAHGMAIEFKGGWRSDVVHQSALLLRGDRRVAVAVLTSGESMADGEATIEGIASRVLR